MNREVLMLLLRQAFGGTVDERRVVARSAGDLADSGRYRDDSGTELAPQTIVEHLADAPEGSDLVERWNWWMGSLELAYGGYDEFRVRRTDETADDP